MYICREETVVYKAAVINNSANLTLVGLGGCMLAMNIDLSYEYIPLSHEYILESSYKHGASRGISRVAWLVIWALS